MTKNAETSVSQFFHAVQFYRDTDSLAQLVALFLGNGFADMAPALVIATPEHRHAIARELRSRSLDVERLETSGDLMMLDATAVLSQFMVHGMPDPTLFRSAVVRLVGKARQGRPNCVVRLYGEGVDVLWKAGLTAAAIRLEALWNEMALTHALSVLCGYSLSNSYDADAQLAICRQHTHIIPGDGYAPVMN